MNPFQFFTGGVLDTNAFLFRAPEGNILFDAPQGADAAFAKEKISLLVLTHGHFDHVADAAAVSKRHGCPVYMHPLTVPMVEDPGFFKRWGFQLEVEPVSPDQLVDAGRHTWLGETVEVFHVPGHCPGSLHPHPFGGSFDRRGRAFLWWGGTMGSARRRLRGVNLRHQKASAAAARFHARFSRAWTRNNHRTRTGHQPVYSGLTRACYELWRAFAGEDFGDSQGTSEVPVCKPHWSSE